MARTHVSPIRLRLDQLLADGEWHDRHQLLDVLTPLVPPGQATRQARRTRVAARARRTDTVTHPNRSHRADNANRQAIDVGARRTVSDTLNTAVRFGSVESRIDDGHRQYRKAQP